MGGQESAGLRLFHVIEGAVPLGPGGDTLQRYIERHVTIDERKQWGRISQNKVQELEQAPAAGRGSKERRPGLLHYALIEKDYLMPGIAEPFEPGRPSSQASRVPHGLAAAGANGQNSQPRAAGEVEVT